MKASTQQCILDLQNKITTTHIGIHIHKEA
jgi:hypothetical protein